MSITSIIGVVGGSGAARVDRTDSRSARVLDDTSVTFNLGPGARLDPRPGPGGSAPARSRSPVISSCSAERLHGHALLLRDVDDPLAHLAGADGIAISTSSGSASRKTRGSRRRPRTRTPWMRRFFLRGSSSRARSGCSRSQAPLDLADDHWPALPAPTIRPRVRGRRSRRARGRSISVRRPAASRRRTRGAVACPSPRSRAAAGCCVRRRSRASGRRERGDVHAARRSPHVPRRDVAPPAVVEAEQDEDGELDRTTIANVCHESSARRRAEPTGRSGSRTSSHHAAAIRTASARVAGSGAG